MVLAPRSKSSSAIASVATLLGEFQLEIISLESLHVRDRSIATFLVKISPDHTQALDMDLSQIATAEEIDIATEFIAYSPVGSEPSVAELVIASKKLKSSQLAKVLAELSRLGISISGMRSSELESFAISVVASPASLLELKAALTAVSRSEGVAVNMLPFATTRKLVVLDMDSTVINEEVIDQLALHAGVGEQVSEITERAMRGEIDFESALNQRVAMLKGLSNGALEQVRSLLTLTAGVQDFVREAHHNGHILAVVSGGFHNVIDPLLKDLGVDYILANTLQTTAAGLTGEISGPVVDADRKANFLQELARKYEIPLSQTVAIGDGANDIEMVKVAGVGIAFCAKPSLQEVADIVLNERDLSLVLPLLGM